MYEFSSKDLHYVYNNNVPNPVRFPMHLHDRFEILCILRGDGNCTVEGMECPIRDNTIILTRPSETHKITPNPDVVYERVQVHFSQELIHSVDPEEFLLEAFCDRPLGADLLYSFYEFTDMDVGQLFKNMQISSGIDAEQRVKILSGLLYFLEKLRHAFYNQNFIKNEYSKVNTILQYINNHLFEELSLDKIAAELYISRSQLTRAFKQKTGSTINEYITLKRLIVARQMIMRGSSAGDACFSSGFKDYSSFFRAYKKFFGVSPSNKNEQPLIDKIN